jgi:signal peptidase II
VFWGIASAVVALDQITKQLAESSMELNQTIPLIRGMLGLTYIHNYGAAFSILQNQRVFLISFTGLAMIAIIIYVLKEQKKIPGAEKAALALIVGGGLGNLIDRVMNGYVIDFINIYILPVFNVADMSVCAGSALLIYSVVVLEPRLRKDRPK